MTFPKLSTGWLITITLCVFTVGLWYIERPGINPFRTTPLALTSLAQVSGLIGLVLFSLSLFLSGRFSFTENLFGGMNRVYIAHHQMGGISFILLMLHPLFVASSYLPLSLKRAAMQLLPSAVNWEQNLGIASLLCLMALMIITFYVTIPYQLWRLTHKFMGAAFFFGAVHSLFIPSTISRFLPLKIFILSICVPAVLAYLYRTVLGRFFIRRYMYVVESVKNIGNQTIEMLLHPADLPMVYSPGQFLFINFPRNSILKEVHPFSISSSPTNPLLQVSAKALGDYTTKLLDLKPGDIAQVEGPYGRFTYFNFKNKLQVWIAGGIGITPFLSMANSLSPEYSAILYYCAKDEAEAVYSPQLQQLAQTKPNLKFVPFYSKTQGRISAEVFVKDLGPEFRKYDFFICGPPPMMNSLRSGLNKKGIPQYRIHTEEFNIN
jgi:predicted ferric reductase